MRRKTCGPFHSSQISTLVLFPLWSVFVNSDFIVRLNENAIIQELLLQKLFPQIMRKKENFQSVAVVSSSYIVQKRVNSPSLQSAALFDPSWTRAPAHCVSKLSHGLLNRWTDIFLFRHAKGKSMVKFHIFNALGQNFGNSESCPILRF